MIVEGKQSVFLGGQAWLVNEDREMAWAEKHVVSNPAVKWILGRYVEGEAPNDNGHIFATAELEAAQTTLHNAPLNLLHHPHYIIGSFVATEMVYPTAATAGVEAPANAVMEALSGMWRYYYPEEHAEIEKAHAMGHLYYSMEAVPKTVTCAAVCGETFEYAGRFSDSYCAHINETGGKKRLNQPHFMGGALIIPPTKPGWKGAGVTELSSLVARREAEAAAIYDGLRSELPHLNPATWETMMFSILEQAFVESEGGEWAKKFSTARRKALASQGNALPDGSYRIASVEDLGNAIQAYGWSKAADRGKVKAHIIKRAKALGRADMIPDGWNS